MKAVVGLLLALCVARAVSQTTSEFDCFLDASISLATQSPTCASSLTTTLASTDGSDRSGFCASQCATTANNFFVNACNFPLVQILCTKETAESSNYCITQDNVANVGTMIGQVLAGDCLATDCSNTACNNAVQALSCCVDVVTRYNMGVVGIGSLLPDNCMLPEGQCSATFGSGGSGGGAPSLLAMPVVIVTAIVAALMATF